jgi:hypothetical protein
MSSMYTAWGGLVGARVGEGLPSAPPPPLGSLREFKAWLLAELASKPLPPSATCLEHALEIVKSESADGLLLEFGVFSGRSLWTMADRCPAATVVGFDSFEGLPGKWRDGFDKGAFDLKSQVPPLPANAGVFKGWFDQTVPRFRRLLGSDVRVDLIHIDCDMYASTKAVFDGLADKIRGGTLLVFDELVNYPGYEEHELKALFELCVANPERRLLVVGMVGSPSDGQHEQAVLRMY